MSTDNLLTFPRSPREREIRLRKRHAASASPPPPRFSLLRRIARRLIAATGWAALWVILAAALLAAWLGRILFGVLSLGFLGKLWLHWGQPSVWVPALEFGLSFTIFCVLSVFTVWASPPRAKTPVQVVRLSLWDRLLLAPRR